MANILMINLPFAGHTNPTLPLASSLTWRGHKVSYINAEEFRVKIETTGAQFIPYINYPSCPSEQQKKVQSFKAAYDTALSLNEKYDLLIYEMFFYPGIRIAEKLNIPCVRQFSQPAWNIETLYDASLFFKISCWLIDRQVMRKKYKQQMELSNHNLSKAVINDKPNLNIVYVPEIFQEKREYFPSNYLFTVPPIQENAKENLQYDKMKRPIIYISLGSIISNKGFCKECIRAFGGKEFSVILNTGKVNPKDLRKIPDNVYAYSFVPQIEVLKHADVFLTHCGMNSVNEAIMHGVPMVAMPFVNDQIMNAKRIVELGIGKKVRSFPSSGRELYNTAVIVYKDETIRERCRELQHKLKDEMTWDSIVDSIESLI